ncbi:hypothetical protein RHMOL_Rhmol11G0168200 [Rhododendron molle]|uniref:Uncharacterized protein n=1 Tax=Rhododendron molle TaxID=49168 RepID=A0ACC0LTA7_RHOML|nr:hypothetical protein RHMOL_Rhmol11G0168200 [Rhododendron molle]
MIILWVVTLFVDNIPDKATHLWLRKVFNNYGVIRDAFIPVKRSSKTGSKFGFVRYNCSVSADMAIFRAHGKEVDNRKLVVKLAYFTQNGSKERVLKTHSRLLQGNKQMGVKRTENLGQLSKSNPAGIGPGAVRFESSSSANLESFKSYAQTLVGDTARKETEEGLKCSDQRSRKVSLKSAGNGWLYRSAVAKLHRLISISELKVQMAGMGLDNIEIKAMGGRDLFLSTDESFMKMSSFAVAKILIATSLVVGHEGRGMNGKRGKTGKIEISSVKAGDKEKSSRFAGDSRRRRRRREEGVGLGLRGHFYTA